MLTASADLCLPADAGARPLQAGLAFRSFVNSDRFLYLFFIKGPMLGRFIWSKRQKRRKGLAKINFGL